MHPSLARDGELARLQLTQLDEALARERRREELRASQFLAHFISFSGRRRVQFDLTHGARQRVATFHARSEKDAPTVSPAPSRSFRLEPVSQIAECHLS